MLDIGVKKLCYNFLVFYLKYITKEFCPNIHNIFWSCMMKYTINNIATLFVVGCNSFLPKKINEGDGGMAMNFSFLTYQSNMKKEAIE